MHQNKAKICVNYNCTSVLLPLRLMEGSFSSPGSSMLFHPEYLHRNDHTHTISYFIKSSSTLFIPLGDFVIVWTVTQPRG